MTRVFPLISFMCAIVVACGAAVQAQGRETFVSALVDFTNAVNASPHDAQAVTAALDAMSRGLMEWDAAIGRAEAGLAADVAAAPPPAAARMHGALGSLYLERGRAADAVAQFDRAARTAAAPPDLEWFRGWALRAAGRAVEAAAAFERAAAAAPGNPIRAYEAWHHARVAAARSSLRAADAAVIQRLEPHVATAASGATPFIRPSLLADTAAAEPILPPFAYAAGYALAAGSRYAEAIAAWRTAAAAPDAAREEQARLAHADSLAGGGKAQEAGQVLRDLIAAAPAAARARWRLARLYQALGREAEALEQYEAVAATSPLAGAGALHRLIGQLRENQFSSDAAIAAFVTAIDLDPNDAASHRELAEALHALDRTDEARAEFVISLHLDPRSAAAWTGLGQVHAAGERLDDALAAFERAVALDPRHPEARYGRARALMRLGRAAEGERELGVFEQLQKQAMDEQRRRYEADLQQIERARDVSPAPGRAQ